MPAAPRRPTARLRGCRSRRARESFRGIPSNTSRRLMAAPRIDASELIPLADYMKRHHEIRRELIEIRARRRVEVGPWVSFTFENRRTVLYQIQEMIRVEHLTDAAKVRDEIAAYEELLPGPD